MRRKLPLLLTALLRFMAVLSFGMLLQLRLRELGASILLITSLSTIRGAITTLSSPLWGAVSDHLKKRKLFLLMSLGVPALLYPIYAILDIPYTFIIIAGVIAFFSSGYDPIAMAMSTDLADGSLVSTSHELALLNSASSIGMFLGRVSLSVLLLWLSVKNTILFFSMIALLAFIQAFFISEKNSVHEIERQRKRSFIFPSAIFDVDRMKRNGLWAVYLGSFIRQFGIAGTTSLIAVYMTEVVGLSKSLAVLLSGLNPLLQIFSHIFFGKVIGKIGSKISLVIGIYLSGVTSLLFAVSKNWMLVAAAYLSLGIAFGAFINGAATFITLNSPQHKKAESLGLLRSARALGFMLGPITAGLIAEYSYVAMFIFMMTASFFSGTMVLLFSRENTRD